jgi:hypothetical protein
LSKGDSDIIKYLKDLEGESKNLKMDLFKICWFMRGGISYQESLNLSPDERKIISDLVKDNLETTKKTGRDFF